MGAVGAGDLLFADDVPPVDRPRAAAILLALGYPGLDGAAVRSLAGGASNANYLVETASGTRLVLRIARPADRFGIDRFRGADAQRAVASIGLAPALLGAALPAGHALSPFVDGVVLDAARLREPGMLRRVGEALRAVHGAPAIAGGFSVFADQRAYVELSRAEGLTLPPDIDELMRHAAAIEELFAACAIPDRLCHNDLQLPNFIARPDGGMTVLDWEYAGMGNPYFDLGGVTANGELARAERRELLEGYFGEVDPRHDARIELMLYMSALREGTWAVVAEPALDLDWDYQAWAAEFYDRCRRAIPGLAAALAEAR